MSGSHSFESDLREMIRRGQVVAVVGSGVSLATNSQAPTWRGLIESALDRCRAIGAPADWCDAVAALLALPHGDTLLSAAELVHQRLSEAGGEWTRPRLAGRHPIRLAGW